MEALKRYKNVLLLIVVIGALFIAYTVLFVDGEKDNLLGTGGPLGPTAVVERELLGLLLEIKTVELSGSIFSDPVFQSLQDFSQELIPLPIGRNNPFAPFGIGNFPASGSL